MGRFSDGNIFSNGVLAKKIMKQTVLLPIPMLLSTIESPMPYIFVGDEAFPLSESQMRPYPKISVTNNYENKLFNDRLSRARQTAECAFGVLASCFRIFKN